MDRLIALVLATLLLVCGSAASAWSQASPAADGVKFPSPGMTYAKAKDLLLRQGLKLDTASVRSPRPGLKELDCADQPPCRALFVQTDAKGWGQYLIVEVDQRSLIVSNARWPLDVDGLPAIPPPLAHDIPALPKSYWKARKQLLRLGFTPVRTRGKPLRVCLAEMEGKTEDACEPDVLLPEVSDCMPTGLGWCEAVWLDPKKQRTLHVTTTGDPQPGAIYYLKWAGRPR